MPTDYPTLVAQANVVGKSYAAVGGCWGLVRAVLSRAGISMPVAIDDALAAADAITEAVPPGQAARGGDILLMTWPPEMGRCQHVGLCLSPFEVVHAWRDDESTQEGEVRRTPLGALTRLGARCELRRPRR